METGLGDVLNDAAPVVEAPEVVTEEVRAEGDQADGGVEQEQATEAETGEKEATPATEQDDPIKRHIKGLEAAAVAERRRRQELEAQLAALQRPEPAAPQVAEKPKPDAFQTTEAYIEAVAEWKAGEVLQAVEKRRQVEQQHQQELARAEGYQRKANELVAKGQVKYADFDAAINGGLAPFLSEDLRQALMLGDAGHDVAYHLAKTPGEAARLAAMHPMEMVREVSLIESRLKTQVMQPRPQIPQTLTQARNARGEFAMAGTDGPTPLDAVLGRKT